MPVMELGSVEWSRVQATLPGGDAAHEPGWSQRELRLSWDFVTGTFALRGSTDEVLVSGFVSPNASGARLVERVDAENYRWTLDGGTVVETYLRGCGCRG